MERKAVLVCSNGVNSGCGSIAVSVDEVLSSAGYDCIHCSSGGSLDHLQRAKKPVYEVIGYVEKMKKARVDEAGCVLDYLWKNLRYTLQDRRVIDEIIDKHQPVVCVSIYEGFVAYNCYYRGIPVVEFSDMLFFGLKLHQCTPTERDHVRNYLTGLNVAMAPYTRGCALTLFPQEIEGCQVGVPENCTVTGPLLARDIRQMTPLPRSVRDHVTVYVSGATEKCQWLYSVLSKITSHRFVVFSPYDESLTCPNLGDNVEIRRVNRAGFLQSMAYSYACVTNAGMQTAAEALYLQVPNYMLPTANHHAQCAVSESVQRANGGETCLRDVKSETKACPDFAGRLSVFLDRHRHAEWTAETPDPDEAGRTLLRAVQECDQMGPLPAQPSPFRWTFVVLGLLVTLAAVYGVGFLLGRLLRGL